MNYIATVWVEWHDHGGVFYSSRVVMRATADVTTDPKTAILAAAARLVNHADPYAPHLTVGPIGIAK